MSKVKFLYRKGYQLLIALVVTGLFVSCSSSDDSPEAQLASGHSQSSLVTSPSAEFSGYDPDSVHIVISHDSLINNDIPVNANAKTTGHEIMDCEEYLTVTDRHRQTDRAHFREAEGNLVARVHFDRALGPYSLKNQIMVLHRRVCSVNGIEILNMILSVYVFPIADEGSGLSEVINLALLDKSNLHRNAIFIDAAALNNPSGRIQSDVNVLEVTRTNISRGSFAEASSGPSGLQAHQARSLNVLRSSEMVALADDGANTPLRYLVSLVDATGAPIVPELDDYEVEVESDEGVDLASDIVVDDAFPFAFIVGAVSVNTSNFPQESTWLSFSTSISYQDLNNKFNSALGNAIVGLGSGAGDSGVSGISSGGSGGTMAGGPGAGDEGYSL